MTKPDPYASHLPALLFVVRRLDWRIRSILEIGCGFYSTPLLRAFASGASARGCRHVILESNPEWAGQAERLFDVTIDLADARVLPEATVARSWDLVFIDCEVEASRAGHALRLRDRAGVIVLHDSNPNWDHAYGYSKILDRWKHAVQFTDCYPHTLLLTNDDEAWEALASWPRPTRTDPRTEVIE